LKRKKADDPICRSFRQDFPEFVDRASALGFRIQLSPGRRKPDQDRVFFANGYKQLTGFLTRSDGRRFTREDAVSNIDGFLTWAEEDRAIMAGLSVAERFGRVMEQMRKLTPQSRMIGEVRLPGGDTGHCFFNASYEGGVDLHEVGKVARGEAEWRRDEAQADQITRFCDALEADFAQRQSMKAA
jgi:hypothetical protein